MREQPAKCSHRPLKIMHLVWSLERAGAEQLVFDLTRLSDADRFYHSVCCLGTGGALAEKYEQLGRPPMVLGKQSRADAFRVLRNAARYLKNENPDIVHIHREGPDLWGAIIAMCANTGTVVVTEHSDFDGARRPRFFPTTVRRILKNQPAQTIAISESVRESIVRFGVADETRVVVIHNGIDSASFTPCVPPRQMASPVVIGTTGRLEEYKGHQDILTAVAALKGSRHAVRLVIAGEGPYRAALEKEAEKLDIQDLVDLPGVVDDVPAFLQTLDLFVFPSHVEGFGIALIEAMSCGLPVIAAATGGIPEILRHEIDGLLVSPRQPALLADAIRRFLDHPETMASYGANARERVVEHFDIQRMISRYEEVYLKIGAASGVHHEHAV